MQNALLTTLAQIGHRTLRTTTLTWLLGANSRAVSVRYTAVSTFVSGALLGGGTTTCTGIARSGLVSHDAMTRLLSDDPVVGLQQIVALSQVKRDEGYLVIDDVVIGKTGTKIDGVQYLYSSAEEKTVLGLNAVVLGWTDGTVFIPLTFRFWKRTKDGKPPKRRRTRKRKKGQPPMPPVLAFDDTLFRTKIELAIEMLDWAFRTGFEPTAVLFDAYYLCADVLRRLKRRDWHWVSRIKGNRRLKQGDQWTSPKAWVEGAAVGKTSILAQGTRAGLPDWGEVRIVAVKRKTDAEARFLVGSNPNWGKDKVERLYGLRWAIETCFRDTNQALGLKGCQSRKFLAQENHFALIMLAYVFLESQKVGDESAGSTLRRLIDRPIAIYDDPLPPKIRQIKPEKRRRHHHALAVPISGCAA